MEVKFNSALLPLRDIVVFPHMVIPLFVGRDKSITALNEVMKKDKKIVLVTQKNSEVDDPKKNDIFNYGCESSILQLLKLPDGTVKVLVEGITRVKINEFQDNNEYLSCSYEKLSDVLSKDEDLMTLALNSIKKLEKLTSINKKISNETINNIKLLKDPSKISDNIASHLNATISEKQQVFETLDLKKRLNLINKIMDNETSIIGVEKRIRGRVKTQMEKTVEELAARKMPELKIDEPIVKLDTRSVNVSLDVGPGDFKAAFSLAGFNPIPDGFGQELVFDLHELDRNPSILKSGILRYPSNLKRKGLEGEVRLLVLIDEKGKVKVLEVVSSTHPDFVKPSREAAENSVYEPPRRNGEAVKVQFYLPVRFSLLNQ